MSYPNSYLYTATAPWLSKPVTTLYFSTPDLASIDEESTVSLLETWADADPVNLWDDDSDVTVTHYEGPGEDGVDVYKLSGYGAPAPDPDAPAWVRQEPSYTDYPADQVAVPIEEIDGTIHFYMLDDLGW